MDNISAIGFGPTVDMLDNAISGSNLEQSAIAENIANVNTPNYRRQTTSFKDALAQAAGMPAEDGAFGMKTDDDRQFEIDGGQPVPFNPTVSVDQTDQMRVDGSNVDVDQEMAQLAQNSGYSQTMAQLLQVQFMRLREAITEQPR